MKRYQCHKLVDAAPIVAVVRSDDPDGQHKVLVSVNGVGEVVKVPSNFFGRGSPVPDDYLVVYLPDGYISWSPKAAFEDGYAELPGQTSTHSPPGSGGSRDRLDKDDGRG